MPNLQQKISQIFSESRRNSGQIGFHLARLASLRSVELQLAGELHTKRR